jgi:antitoxin (DNA-binding transcriptional repressor) of toxin-antitoxin stability system
MKAIKVSELKAHLSRYLRMASQGASIIVKDRDQPLAQIGPVRDAAGSWWDRMASEGRLRPGSQRWDTLKVTALGRAIDVQGALQAVREEPSEVCRR